MTGRDALALAIITLGCAGPAEGAPCEPGADLPHIEYGNHFLICFGPPGCTDDLVYTYEWGSERVQPVVCGCDGLSTSFGEGRWQFYGPCDGCGSVDYEPGRGYYINAWEGLEPVSPRCTLCADARPDAAGDCVGADGSARASNCCMCAVVDGVCVHQFNGQPAVPECCTR